MLSRLRPVAAASRVVASVSKIPVLLAGVRRTFAFMLTVSRWLTVGVVSVSTAQSLVPPVQIALNAMIVNAVVTMLARTGGPPQLSAVAPLILLQLVVTLMGSLLQTLSTIWQQLLEERAAIQVQIMIMEHIATLDLAHFERAEFYDKLHRAQEQSTGRSMQVVAQSVSALRSIVTLISVAILLFQLSWIIGVLTLLSPLPSFIATSKYGVLGYYLAKILSPSRRMMEYCTSVLSSDSLHKEVQIYQLGPFFISRYRKLATAFYDENRSLLIRRYLLAFAWGSISTLTTTAAYFYVASLVIARSITVGGVALFLQAVTNVQQNFQSALTSIQAMYENNLYLGTLFELLETAPAIRPPPIPAPLCLPFTHGIELRNVSFQYPGSSDFALKDVSLEISPGETVAIVGRNGAGKSTIVKLLTRMYDPCEGSIWVNGRDIREYDPVSLRQHIAVVFQDYGQYQLTLAENIGLGDTSRLHAREVIERAAERSDLTKLAQDLPNGYETVLGKRFSGGHELSGGQWQKVAIARAFMRDAQILILDEPSSALDPEAEFKLLARMRELSEGKTTIYISHRFSSVRSAETIVVLDEGRVVECGPHASLVARVGLYAELFERQASSYR